MNSVRILKHYCKGCGLCVSVCRTDALRMSDDVTPAGFHVAEVVDVAGCTGCANCAVICPDAAVEIVIEEKERAQAPG